MSPPAKPRVTGTRTLYRGWGHYLAADLRMPDGGEFSREVEDHGRAVAVLPYDPVRRIALLVQQFRAPPCLVDGTEGLLEAPAGLLDEDDPAACARREAFEETGLRLAEVEHVGQAFTMPGISTELMDYYLAPYAEADRAGAGGGLAAEHENITVLELPLADLAARMARGEIRDLKTLFLLQALSLRRPELFAEAP
jgi:nudix-type nucleoside diphosphatase (YffH/AdpP family)